MNQLLKGFFCILLSSIVLLVGGGFTVSKMVCLKSGYTEYSLSRSGACCGDDCATASISESCCDISNVSIEQESFTESRTVVLDQAQLFLVSTILSLFSDPFTDSSIWSNSSPVDELRIPHPPLHILNSVFRI